MGGILSNLEGAVLYIILGLLFMLLSIVVIVAAFFIPLVKFTKPKTNAAWITDFISIIFAVETFAERCGDGETTNPFKLSSPL